MSLSKYEVTRANVADKTKEIFQDFLKPDRCHKLLQEHFSDFGNCPFCLVFRESLNKRDFYTGVCRDCSLQKYAEKIFGRQIIANGCHFIPEFKSLIKELEFCEEMQCFDEKCIEKVQEKIKAAVEFLNTKYAR